jgi:glycosyltransferase involved in cell wall biosynthesis
MIKVSVVIPTYKRPGLLQNCIKALLVQHFDRREFEIIVVADGPDNETAAMVKRISLEHPSYLIGLRQLPLKGGPAAARNTGWQTANGRLIVFTDDDCVPEQGCLQAYWKAYVHSDQIHIAFTGKVIVPRPPQPTDYEKNISQLERAVFVTANCACTKLALQRVGGFDEDFTMAWREDSELHFKLMGAHVPIVHVPEAVVIHPARKAGWGVSLFTEKKNLFNALLFRKHPVFFRRWIGNTSLKHYYIIIILFLVGIGAILLHWPVIATVALYAWLVMEMAFIRKRLKGTSKRFDHVLEMIITSLLIPWIAVFWSWYGYLKFSKRTYDKSRNDKENSHFTGAAVG